MGATLVSTTLGFFREVLNAKFYGTQQEMDAFLAAATIPTILFGVFQGALLSALVPTFSEYLSHGEEDEAWRLANTIINGLFIILAACAGIGYVLAPLYVPIIAHGFPAPEMSETISMTRWLMPTIVFVSLSGVFSAILNAYHRFRSASLVGLSVNAVTITCVIGLNQKLGIYALVLGTVLGLAAQLLVQLPAMLSIRKYRFYIDAQHPGLGRMWAMLGPIVVGSAAGQVALFFDRYFASTLTPGYISGMNYVTKIVGFPQQIFAAAIATVMFPLLASKFAHMDRTGVARSVVTGLRMVNFITVPAVCALIVLARPIVQVLFERGTFKSSATDLCSTLLPYAAVGLVALAANVVLTRCCFACKETRWTVFISVTTVVANVILSLIWLPSLGARGLLLANSLTQTMQAIFLLLLANRLLRHVDWRALTRSIGQIALSCAAMVLVLYWIASFGQPSPAASLLSRAFHLASEIALGGIVFLATCRVLNVEELAIATKLITAKFQRAVIGPPENRNVPIA